MMVFLAQDSNEPGTYALGLPFGTGTPTQVAADAMHHRTQADCQAWCDANNQGRAWAPVEMDIEHPNGF
jgi:hypothetical protein